MEKSLVDAVNASLGRCIMKPGFIDTFYDNFVNLDPSIGKYFEKTDMTKQKSLLKQGLTFVVMAAGGSNFALREVEKLQVMHDRKHMNIPAHLYPLWVDALLTTIRQYDNKLDTGLEGKWRQVLNFGVEKISDHGRASA